MMHRARLVALLLAIGALAAVTGCNDGASDEESPPRPTAMLVIVLEDSTATPPLERRWTLECGPASGDLPNAESACERLAALEDPWAPVPADVACAEIFAGPQTVAVTGSFDGEAVDASFSRNNACETERFDRVATALGITLS